MIKKTKLLIFLIFILFSIFQASTTVLAIEGSGCSGGTCTLDNPLGKITTPQQIIGKIISAVLGIVGSIALIMFIYGGLTWMMAAGNAQNVDKGKNILMWATIGLVIIFSAYALTKFVLNGMMGVPIT